MSAIEETTTSVFGATLTRRTFIKGSGALVVGLSVPTAFTAGSARAAGPSNSLDPSQLASWLEIRADNTILMRTGIAEMGQGSVSGSYKQIVAEELNVPFEAITTVVFGDTDRTPDGGVAAGLTHKIAGSPANEALGKGGLNVQKVAAYTYQALLGLASTTLGVPTANLSVKDGVVSGGGKSISYGKLVEGQQLNLTIPTTGSALTSNLVVTGAPPTKPVSQYTIVGKSYPMGVTPDIVSGKATWVGNIRLPGMLQGQMVRPPTFGSTLISVGKLDKKQFPTSQVVVKGNLVAVLSPNQWEAIQAANAVGRNTKWTEWSGLPGSGNLFGALRSADYSKAPTITGAASAKGNPGTALASAAKTLSSTYFVPYVKHGPIGPSITVADVRSDGTVYIFAHTQKAQSLRASMANMLGISTDKVVVRVFDGAGHYGRSNGGIEGSEADAVILSQMVGKPVMVQWLRPEDMQWSTSSPAYLMDVQAGLDASGNMIAFQADYYAPGTGDERPVGALLAGLPAGNVTFSNGISTNWVYDKVPNVVERGHATQQLGQATSPLQIGLRPHSMRTPSQRQQNFALEGMVNEAAAAAGVDPIEYRLKHTTNQRAINVLNALKAESGWQTRPSPNPKASATGSTPVSGQGMSFMLRSDAYMAAAVNITVNPKTGKIAVNSYTAVVEPGIVLNPRQLRLVFEGGTVQGFSEALYEELAFDKSKITSTDWVSYPIMRIGQLPPIKVVILDRRDLNVVGGGSEPPNALVLGAMTAAFFDATGKQARSLPLRAARVKELLKA
jgi:nicotinate dehydrogenase subunit B